MLSKMAVLRRSYEIDIRLIKTIIREIETE